MINSKRLCVSVAAMLVAFSLAQPTHAASLTTVQKRVTDIRNKINETIQSLRDGRNKFTSDLRASVTEAIETAKTTVADEKAGRDEFIAVGCEAFKASTTDMLLASQDAVDSALAIAGLNGGLFNTERARAKVNDASCRLLYPVYRAVGPGIEQAQADITVSANATANGFSRLQTIIEDQTRPLECKSGSAPVCAVLESRNCGAYVRNAAEITEILDVGRKTVTGLRVSGKTASAAGKIGIWKAVVAIWGWVGGDIEFNLPEFIAETTAAVAEAIEPQVQKQTIRLNSCVALFAQDRTLFKLNKLLAQN